MELAIRREPLDIPVGVEVTCNTQVCGRSTYLVINPIDEQVTHLVVAENAFPHVERLVPIGYVIESTPTSIRLRCTPPEFAEMDNFLEADYIQDDKVEAGLPYEGPYVIWPYSAYDAVPMPLVHERIPAGEVVIRRGSQVRATDGDVGKVDEFLVNPTNNCISHLVMRKGHLWGARDVTIPVSEIEEIDGVVHLKLDKEAIARLPAISVRRKWK
jgi:sporulation protein YlmC with PRC-barrel domain